MKYFFLSQDCKYCQELIIYMNKNDLLKEFKCIDINKTKKLPSSIKMVPTIIDPDCNNLFEGKKAFDYIYSDKYFNVKTNNINNWKNKTIAKPDIKKDDLAIDDFDYCPNDNAK